MRVYIEFEQGMKGIYFRSSLRLRKYFVEVKSLENVNRK
jgi:hypothetical protein